MTVNDASRWLQEILRDPGMGSRENPKIGHEIACAILTFAGDGGKVSVEQIVEVTGHSERSVQRWTNRMEEAGYLSKDSPPRRGKGRGVWTTFSPLINPANSVSETPPTERVGGRKYQASKQASLRSPVTRASTSTSERAPSQALVGGPDDPATASLGATPSSPPTVDLPEAVERQLERLLDLEHAHDHYAHSSEPGSASTARELAREIEALKAEIPWDTIGASQEVCST